MDKILHFVLAVKISHFVTMVDHFLEIIIASSSHPVDYNLARFLALLYAFIPLSDFRTASHESQFRNTILSASIFLQSLYPTADLFR